MDTPPEVAVPPDTVAAIMAHYGLGTAAVERLSHGGTSNSVYLLGEQFVLRVPRNDPNRISGVASEVTASTAARSAGVRTPQVIVVDQSREFLPVPFAIYERVHGVPLATLSQSEPSHPETWRALGQDLARLHLGVSRDGPAGQLREVGSDLDPLPWLDHMAASGAILGEEARWLRRWLDLLAPFTGQLSAPAFCHGDVHASNVIVHGASFEYLALLDWGGAGWGDGAWDFVPVALHHVPPMLAGYRSLARLERDDTAEARILWHHIQFALFGLRFGPQRARDWVEQRLARLRAAADRFLAEPGAQWMARLG